MSETLLGRSTGELEALATALAQPAYRGRQLSRWLYQQAAREVGQMTDLPLSFRQALEASYTIGRSEVVADQRSRDGTAKLLLQLADGARVETVGLPYADRVSVCLSSQTGCAVGCAFCATGYLGAGRNLTAGEMVDQVLTVGECLTRRVSHAVFMGMGEPLLNLAQVLAAARLLTGELGLSERHLTISTVGYPPQMDELAAEHLALTLAVSLHAADDDLRASLIPTAARRWSVANVLDAARRYASETGRRVTYEVVLLSGVNDRPQDARLLAERLHPGDHINLIPFNPVRAAPFGRPTTAAMAQFRAILERARLTVTRRQTRGHDIDGACGQLRAANE